MSGKWFEDRVAEPTMNDQTQKHLPRTNLDISDLNSRVAALSPAKRALLEQKLRQSASVRAAGRGMTRRVERRSAPLSFAQQRLWFLNQLEPHSCSYNEVNGIRLHGCLDIDALQRALNRLAERHEILRTTIAIVDGQPQQMIHEPAPVELPLVDLRRAPAERREVETQAVYQNIAARSFDLSRDLPLRVALVQLGDDEHILFKVMHHIASDGWSSGILWRELGRFYQEARSGQDGESDKLVIQYQDYAAWQRDWLQGEILETQLAYWRKQLKDVPALELPTDHPKPLGQQSRSAKAQRHLDVELKEELQQLSKTSGVTLFMTLLAAFQVLLHRYTGQADIAVGSPIAGRNRPEIEGLIGFFVNTLVLRMDLARDPTFKEVLMQARDVALGAYAHQELPFERIVEELNPARDLNGTPLFRVMFAHQNVPRVPIEFAGLTAEPLEVPSGDAKFDLFLAAVEEPEGITLRMQYAVDLFRAASVEGMLVSFATLLKSIVEHPERRISELELITPAEKHRLLLQWNATQQDYPRDKCVHELFEAQTRQTPDDVAVLVNDKRLTYRELDARANQLAHYLRQQGVDLGSTVALCMERSVDAVVGVLAILKAGGVYLPVDPLYPKERRAFMLEDAQAKIVLTKKGLAQVLPDTHAARIVRVDSEWEEVARESVAAPENRAAPDDLAYIIYTSGSTGVPKGVLGHHRGLVNRFAWMWNAYPFEAGEVCCQKTSIGFVDSLWELLGPLLRGVPTVIVSESQAKDPIELIATLARYDVSRIVLVPSLLRTMLETFPELQTQLPRLKFWVSSGEALSSELVKAFQRGLPASRLINLYGSSEVAADVTCWEMGDWDHATSAVSIGRPIANTQAYILDAYLNPVPVGTPGLLYIGGAGVARGYLNQDRLTAERFFAHSFAGEAAQRLYKTGDRARYWADGNIEFLGRVDNQVKIRGHRIELGEIEAVLMQYPAVRQSAAVSRARSNSEATELIAYVAPTAAAAENELRQFLRERLPDYMVPARCVRLDALPLTASGKVDRKALPLPEEITSDRQDYVAPRTADEQMLAVIWAELLGVERVGVHDNFFDLGGHSLLLVRLSDRIKKVSGKEVSLATLFRAPTIAQFALLWAGAERCKAAPSLVPIQASGSRPPMFCVHGAWGSVVFGAELARHLGLQQPFYGLQAAGLEGEQEPLTRIEDMAAHHVREIRRVQPEGPYFLAGLSMGGLVAFEIAQQLSAQGQPVGLLALIDTYCPTRRRAAQVWSSRARRFFVDDVFGRVVFHGRNLLQRDTARGSTYAREKTRLVGKRLAVKLRVDHQGNQVHMGDVYAVKVRKANFAASRSYHPQAYSGRITLFMTADSPLGKQDNCDAWRALALGGLDVRVVPGDHATMLSESHVGVLAETLGHCLERAQAAELDAKY